MGSVTHVYADGTIKVAHLKVGVVWDPSTQGSILSIDYADLSRRLLFEGEQHVEPAGLAVGPGAGAKLCVETEVAEPASPDRVREPSPRTEPLQHEGQEYHAEEDGDGAPPLSSRR